MEILREDENSRKEAQYMGETERWSEWLRRSVGQGHWSQKSWRGGHTCASVRDHYTPNQYC